MASRLLLTSFQILFLKDYISAIGDDAIYGPVDHIYNILGLTVLTN